MRMVGIKADLLENFVQLVARHTGLQVRPQDQETFAQKLGQRMQILKMTDPVQYYQLLNVGGTVNWVPTEPLPRFWPPMPGGSSAQTGAAQGEREWQALVQLLTVGESYFFRDQGQFRLLKTRLLPDLIAQRRQMSLGGLDARRLRLWSAGCSTGEEAYSLAIAAYEVLPPTENWTVTVVGTDLNAGAIAKAKRGLYPAWSFRTVDPAIQAHYFQQRHDAWEIDPKIRGLAQFMVSNLTQDAFPNPQMSLFDVDLILCRNVFIYFESQAIATVLEKFYKTLRPGGYLLTGHAELYGQKLSQFQAQILPESVIYQRPFNTPPYFGHAPIPGAENSFETSPAIANSLGANSFFSCPLPQDLGSPASLASSNPWNTAPLIAGSSASAQPLPASSLPTPTLDETKIQLSQAKQWLQMSAPAQAIQVAQQILQQKPQVLEAHTILAQAYANLGNYAAAKQACQQAIAINAFAAAPYYLLAQISEEQGDRETAKTLFKKVIYLQPKTVFAYLQLATLHEQEGDRNRAQKMLQTALSLLQELPAQTPIEFHPDLTAGSLLPEVQNTLKNYT